MHENRVEFQVSGDYALFSEITTRVGGEKCSYQIPTYEALNGIHNTYFINYPCNRRLPVDAVKNPLQRLIRRNMNRPELENDRNEKSITTLQNA